MNKIVELKTKNRVCDNKLIYFDLIEGPFKRAMDYGHSQTLMKILL